MQLGHGLSLPLSALRRAGGEPIASSVFDGGTVRAYSGSAANNAGDLLGSGTLPAKAFANWTGVLGTRQKRGTWSLTITIPGTIRGIVLRSADGTVVQWIDVVSGAAVGDTVGIDHPNVQIGDSITFSAHEWDSMPHVFSTTGYDTLTVRNFDVFGGAAEGWDTNESIVNPVTPPSGPSSIVGLVTDSRSRLGNHSVLRMREPAGFLGGYPPGIVAFRTDLIPGKVYKDIIVRMWIRTSRPFQGHSSTTNKIGYQYVTNDKPGNPEGGALLFDRLVFSGMASDGATMKYEVGCQGTPDEDASRSRYTGALDGSGIVYMTPGTQIKIERRTRLNTPGSANGIIAAALNGVLGINATNAKILADATTNGAISKTTLEPIFGGGSSDTVTNTQDWFFDRVEIYGKET